MAFTSTNGMHVLDKIRYGRIFIASIVNFHSTVETLRDYDDISIMPSNRPVGKASEDNIFANLLKEELEKKKNDIIFARATYALKEGVLIGLDPKKVYLYIEGNDDFLNKAFEKLKEFGIEKVDEITAKKVKEYIDNENNTIASGISLF